MNCINLQQNPYVQNEYTASGKWNLTGIPCNRLTAVFNPILHLNTNIYYLVMFLLHVSASIGPLKGCHLKRNLFIITKINAHLFTSALHVSGFLFAHLQGQDYNFGSGSSLLGMVSEPGR
jgi:hypothetical protein